MAFFKKKFLMAVAPSFKAIVSGASVGLDMINITRPSTLPAIRNSIASISICLVAPIILEQSCLSNKLTQPAADSSFD